MSYDGKMGANLEEIYKAGKVEVRAIADAFMAARDTFDHVTVSPALMRHRDLGTGSAGPNAEFGSLVRTMKAAADHSYVTMDAVANNLVVTAQTLAVLDNDVRQAFLDAGGELP